MVKTIREVLLNSYYTHLDKILEKIENGNKFDLFLMHFDNFSGPTLASSKKDLAILKFIETKNIKVVISPKLEKEWDKLDNDLQDRILNVFDATTEESEIEVILRKKKIFVFFRFFLVDNPIARGSQDMFMLAFVTHEAIDSKKLDETKNKIKEKLTKYFKLFTGNVHKQELNENVIDKFTSLMSTKNPNPTEEQIIREYYNL